MQLWLGHLVSRLYLSCNVETGLDSSQVTKRLLYEVHEYMLKGCADFPLSQWTGLYRHGGDACKLSSSRRSGPHDHTASHFSIFFPEQKTY